MYIIIFSFKEYFNFKRNKIWDINHYMKTRNISNDLRMRIRRYIEYMHEEEKLGIYRGNQLIKTLSSHLKDELLYDSYFKLISKIPIFTKNFSEPFLKKLTLTVEEITFSPEEIIFEVKIN